MEDADVITQQPVRTEGRLFIEKGTLHVAAIDLSATECLELVVAVMFAKQFVGGDVVVAAITEKPDIGLACFL